VKQLSHPVDLIDQLAKRQQLGQGEVMRIAAQTFGREVVSLYDLDRAELTQLTAALDALELVK